MVQIIPPSTGTAGSQGAAGNMGTFSYVIRNNGGTYECYNGQTGAVVSSSATYNTVFNAMLTAAGKTNWSCKWLPGAYTLTDQSYMNGSSTAFSNVTLDFGNAVFTVGADLLQNYSFRFLGKAGAANHSSYITVRGGHWCPNQTTYPYSSGHGAWGFGFKWVDHLRFENVHIYNSAGTGMELTGASGDYNLDARVTGCHVEDCRLAGIEASNSQRQRIDHNDVYNVCQVYPGGGCIQFDSSTGDAASGDGLIIDHNTLWGPSCNDGIYVGSTGMFLRNMVIDGNNMWLTADAGVGYVTGVKAYVNNLNVCNNTINQVNNNRGSAGIKSFGTGGHVHGNKITGNAYYGICADDGSTSGGPYVSDSVNTLIENNTITGTSQDGIMVLQDNVSVFNNRVYCAAGNSINVYANADKTRLFGNDLTSSAANITNNGTNTVMKSYFDKNGAWVA